MKFAALGFVLLLGAANGGGCSNPNYIGVQQYGSITGRVLDATTNRPVPHALVSVGSLYTAYADTAGGFTLPAVPIGEQEVTATAPGYGNASVAVRVVKGVTSSADYIRIAPLEGGPTIPPPAPRASASPAPSGSPSPSPEPSASP